MKFSGRILSLTAVLAAVASPAARASFHFMQIEQVIGGVNGDITAQAIQLRMRSSFQIFVSNARIRAWDSAGANPVLIIDFPSDVPNGATGARVLVTTANFNSKTSPTAVPNFTMTNPIPVSYMAAGSLTFEDTSGTIYWRLSWGGAGYTGSGSVTAVPFGNDDNGNANPPFGGPLPSTSLQALLFGGTAGAQSTTNAADYDLTSGGSVFANNAGQLFTVIAPPRPGDFDGDGDVDLDDYRRLHDCLDGPDGGILPDCDVQDLTGDEAVDLADVALFQNAFGTPP